MNESMRKEYKKLSEIFAREDTKASLLDTLSFDLYNALHWVCYTAKSDEEKAFAEECGNRAIDYYQRSLECNYDRLREYKETGNEKINGFRSLLLTVNSDGIPTRTRVVGIKKGSPVFADECKSESISDEMRRADSLIGELRRWMDYSGTLQEKLEKALKLKAGSALGIGKPPASNYDSDGMTREQSEANAWRNYAIESGMISATNYGATLDELIISLKKCIEFYEKATSIV